MVLIVQDGCHFCEKFKDIKGLVIGKLVEKNGDIKMDVSGNIIEVPVSLPGVPALLDGQVWYIGQKLVEQRLGKEKVMV